MLSFDIITVNNGIPRRGASTSVKITLSNTCVFDAEFNEIVHTLSINKTGALTLNIPKYWSYKYGKLLVQTTKTTESQTTKTLEQLHVILISYMCIPTMYLQASKTLATFEYV